MNFFPWWNSGSKQPGVQGIERPRLPRTPTSTDGRVQSVPSFGTLNEVRDHDAQNVGATGGTCSIELAPFYQDRGESSELAPTDGRVQSVPSFGTLNQFDIKRRDFEIAHEQVQLTLVDLKKYQKSYEHAIRSRIGAMIPWFRSVADKKLNIKVKNYEEAQNQLADKAQDFGAQQASACFNQITNSLSTITVFGSNDKEEAPKHQNFQFGVILRQELQHLLQKLISNKLNGTVGSFGNENPFSDMLADLNRTHGRDNVRFALIHGGTTTLLNQESGEANLASFRYFAGNTTLENVLPMEVAIAACMNQAGQADFEHLTVGAPRDYTEHDARPFFTKGVQVKMWHLDMQGPIFKKMLTYENKKDIQSYELKKITSDVTSPIFELKIAYTKSVNDPDFNHILNRAVTYRFQKNDSFDENARISEENSPVTITCEGGMIDQSFIDNRMPTTIQAQQQEYERSVAAAESE